MIIIINVYQWVFVLATGQPIKFPTYNTKKLSRNTYQKWVEFEINNNNNNTVRHCWYWPSVNLEIAKNIFWEYWLKNFLSYFLGIWNSLAQKLRQNLGKKLRKS